MFFDKWKCLVDVVFLGLAVVLVSVPSFAQTEAEFRLGPTEWADQSADDSIEIDEVISFEVLITNDSATNGGVLRLEGFYPARFSSFTPFGDKLPSSTTTTSSPT